MCPASNPSAQSTGPEDDDASCTFEYAGNKLSIDRETLNRMFTVRGKRTRKRLRLPSWLRIHLARHMYTNHYFHLKTFICSKEPLNRFFNMYDLYNPTKNSRAKDVFMRGIEELAREITVTVVGQDGFRGNRFNEGTDDYLVTDPRYLTAYEYILDEEWDGKLEKKFLDIAEIKEKMTYGWKVALYTLPEIIDLQCFLGGTRWEANATTSNVTPVAAKPSHLDFSTAPYPEPVSPRDGVRVSEEEGPTTAGTGPIHASTSSVVASMCKANSTSEGDSRRKRRRTVEGSGRVDKRRRTVESSRRVET